MNTWELCPKCKGEKKTESKFIPLMYDDCNICDGKGIISSITGLPPKSQESTDVIFDFSYPSKEEFENQIIPILKGLFKNK